MRNTVVSDIRMKEIMCMMSMRMCCAAHFNDKLSCDKN